MKYILLFFVGVVLCVPVSVLAVEACAKLDSNTVCTTIADDYNLSDARVDCNGTFVRLIGMCDNQCDCGKQLSLLVYVGRTCNV